MRWIECKIIEPPIGRQVLAYGPNMGEYSGGVNFEICIWDGSRWWDEGGAEIFWGDSEWTHWMPLPEPPKDPQ